ncbi:HAD family hydrolase [Kitasatospora sp. NPDC089797]|uniref:HAD family hydrolase n=1 Tax=Kitasatospora sp. NPDC089797 TaxID=3155298 RepID=UPI00342962F9
MPLLLFDLDNTLLPRDAAFRAWAQDFLSEHDLPPGDLDWFVTLDGGGYVPRSTVLSAVRRRYGLDASIEFLHAHFRRGINSHIHCPARNIEALQAARTAGWTLGIVSNGGTRPQLEKIRRTGLGPLVDGWVISEEADCVKPDPLIFEIAARRCGVRPTGDWAAHTWMVGDHAPADIAGAELAGLRSVWLHHGRPWAEIGYRPTLKAAGLPEAVGLVLAARNAPSARPGKRPGMRPGARSGLPADAQSDTQSDVRTGGPGRLRQAGAGSGAAGPGVPVRATALLGARSSARTPVSAPEGPNAPVPVEAGRAVVAASGAGPGVRNRSGGFAAIADGVQRTGAPGGTGDGAGDDLRTGDAAATGAHADRVAAPARPAPLRTVAGGAVGTGGTSGAQGVGPARTVFAAAPGATSTALAAHAVAVAKAAAPRAAAPLAAVSGAPRTPSAPAVAAAPTAAAVGQ